MRYFQIGFFAAETVTVNSPIKTKAVADKKENFVLGPINNDPFHLKHYKKVNSSNFAINALPVIPDRTYYETKVDDAITAEEQVVVKYHGLLERNNDKTVKALFTIKNSGKIAEIGDTINLMILKEVYSDSAIMYDFNNKKKISLRK